MPTNHLDADFGVEIECYLPEGSTQAAAAAAVSARLGAPVQPESYSHSLRTHWKVVTDGSLSDYARGIEFVSPVLRGEAGLAQMEKVCKALSDFGCTVNKLCGLHVHVGVAGAPVSFFRNLLKLYATFEPVIDSIMPASRRASANHFCRTMTAVRPAAIDAATTFDAVFMAATGSTRVNREARFFKLNLAAFYRHRTVEFRQHSGTLVAAKARNWTITCLRMVAAAHRGVAISAPNAGTNLNQARPGSKAWRVGQMLLRPEGATGREVCAALGWPSVSMPQQAGMCGLAVTTQRTGREVRYFVRNAAAAVAATPITIDGFASMIDADDSDRNYLRQRADDLRGQIAWAA
jgi:hypothetical protein